MQLPESAHIDLETQTVQLELDTSDLAIRHDIYMVDYSS